MPQGTLLEGDPVMAHINFPEPAERGLSDSSAEARLRRAVLAALTADPLVSSAHIDVAACAGRVTLSGYVTSNAQKDAARDAARRVKGLIQLVDDLMVAVPSPAASAPILAEARRSIAPLRPQRPSGPRQDGAGGFTPSELRP